MSSLTKISATDAKLRSEKGAILFIVAACLVVLLGFMGLAIDLAHAYNNKSQLQSMGDACALAGASALNGTSDGIQEAVDRARDSLNRLSNRKEFNTTTVPLTESDVSFSTTLNGTYMNKTAAQAVASTILYVRVLIPPQQSEVVFAKLIPGIPSFVNVNAEAVAGQLPQTKVCSGLGPFSPSRRDISYPPQAGEVADPTGNFGFVVGQFYSLRKPGNPPNNNPNANNDICADRGVTGQTGNFGLADPQGCGNSVPCYRDTIINGSNGNCVELGTDLDNSPGNMGINIQNGLQARFAQDCVQNGAGNNEPAYPWDDYKNASLALENQDPPPTDCGLWRRVIPVGINDGNIPVGEGDTYNVVGMGCFYMPFPPSATPPSSNICLQYVGRCDETGRPSGTGGPSITRIVLFR
ncbi:MAG: pilus assembly protein TadG-related protein [Acidobacteria bacterium]|nr:pilus assembly protein TadG-related protein [Acidobacteriota bacterium]MCI0724804.1 pilus assembly protein TadG-related protein [Acidobacteriota bacterium]